jgi:hypothetical protein
MIAANLRKHPDAMLRQLELDLAGTIGATETQRAAFWTWLMNTAKVIKRRVVIPAWWKETKARAVKLAKAIQAACLHLMEQLT